MQPGLPTLRLKRVPSLRPQSSKLPTTCVSRPSGRSLMLESDRQGWKAVFLSTALVLPDEALSKNLPGVSFLSRLSRYEYANGRLLLEQ
jgi:hypothetical protein